METVSHWDLRRAAQRGDAHRVAEFWATLRPGGLLLAHDEMALAILRCHPGAAGAMMAGLRSVVQKCSPNEMKAFRGQLYLACNTIREQVKIFSVLHAAGFDLSPQTTFTFAKPIVRQHLAKLAHFRSSNHAALEERRIEPDPDALIARPMGNIFHGTVPGTSRRDILLWQPLIGWWKRQSSEVRTLITLLMFLGLFMAIVLLAMDG